METNYRVVQIRVLVEDRNAEDSVHDALPHIFQDWDGVVTAWAETVEPGEAEEPIIADCESQ